MSCILFSPLGTSDPIRGQYDGPWLHICRMRRPRLMVVYQTKMIAELDALGFYDQSLARLNKLLFGNDASRYLRMEKLQDSACESAHDYNIFMKPFTDALRALHARFPEEELLVNASSGTPAMQITLMYLHLMGDVPFTLLQVVNPEHAHGNNKRVDESYHVEDSWDTDMDNEPNCPDRCVPLQLTPYVMMNRMDALKNLIRREDYAVAETEMDTILPFFFPDKARRLKAERAIRGATLRSRLEIDRALSELRLAGYRLGDEPTTKRKAAFHCVEYLRMMQHDVKGGQFDLFMLRLSPVLLEMTLQLLTANGMTVSSLGLSPSAQGQLMWQQDALPADIRKILSDSSVEVYKLYDIKTYQLLPIVQAKCPATSCQLILQLREVEKKRNIVAHNMLESGRAGAEAWIIRHTGYTCAQILDKLWRLLSFIDADMAASPKDYRDMDDLILSLLE